MTSSPTLPNPPSALFFVLPHPPLPLFFSFHPPPTPPPSFIPLALPKIPENSRTLADAFRTAVVALENWVDMIP